MQAVSAVDAEEVGAPVPLASPAPNRQEGGSMHFADLKNDFVFRRIFATHPDILRGLRQALALANKATFVLKAIS
jgi:hypothetical protein